MMLFLAAVTAFLFIRVLEARDTSLGAVVTKRGWSPQPRCPLVRRVGGL